MAAVASPTSGASAIIRDGVVTNQVTPQQKAEQEKTAESKNSAAAQKDQFLQLLVAQMKYQDPMQPTSNTEYISQYATFSSLEQMQNMSATLTMSRANEMAGKSVVIHHKETGTSATQEIEGIVDYVTFENNKAKVYVNGSAYSVDEVYAVMDDTYTKKAALAESFVKAIDELPELNSLTKDDAKKIENLANSYDQMDATTKSLIDPNYVTSLLQYVKSCTDAGWIGGSSESTGTNGTENGTQAVTPTQETGKTGEETQDPGTGEVTDPGTTEAEKAVTPENKDEDTSTGDEETGEGGITTVGDEVDV